MSNAANFENSSRGFLGLCNQINNNVMQTIHNDLRTGSINSFKKDLEEQRKNYNFSEMIFFKISDEHQLIDYLINAKRCCMSVLNEKVFEVSHKNAILSAMACCNDPGCASALSDEDVNLKIRTGKKDSTN